MQRNFIPMFYEMLEVEAQTFGSSFKQLIE